MAAYTRSGRPRPQGGGFDLAIWYLMRLTGLGLFVLALGHFMIVHVVFDPHVGDYPPGEDELPFVIEDLIKEMGKGK